MISIFCNDGNLYRFPSKKVADQWIEERGYLYDYNPNNLLILTDKPSSDSITLEQTLHFMQCRSCGIFIKAEIAYTEKVDVIQCPKCGCRKKIT